MVISSSIISFVLLEISFMDRCEINFHWLFVMKKMRRTN